MSTTNIKEVVKEKYGQAALRVSTGAGNACCGSAPSSLGCVDPTRPSARVAFDAAPAERLDGPVDAEALQAAWVVANQGHRGRYRLTGFGAASNSAAVIWRMLPSWNRT